MSNPDTERQRYRDTEELSYRDSDDSEDTKEVPPLAASVKTLQEAVQLSLAAGINENCLFIFARAIKAFEITHNRRLSQAELQSAFSLWWSVAKPMLPADADFDEYRFDFEDTFAKTHAPLGANSLQEAIRRAESSPLPPQAERYTSAKLKRLVAVCYQLQLLQVSSPFWMSVRDGGEILGTMNLRNVSTMLAGLVRDGLLVMIEKGTRKRATRFRFNLPPAPPDAATSMSAQPKPTGTGQPIKT
jgi:hypothetical protein